MATTTPPPDAYALTDEQIEFRDAIRKMVAERVAPRAAEIDAKAEYPWDLRRLFAEHDLFGLPFDEEHGGTGTGTLMLNVAVEEIARACASSALMLMIQELGTLPIKLFGSEELKQRFLPRCASGEWSPAFALSEPEAGSDPGGMITRAVRDGDEWVVTGTKNWITNLGVADFYVVFAKTDPEAGHSRGISAFIVEADRPGFSVGKLEHKLGIRGSSDFGKYSAMAKLFASDTAMAVTVEAVQVFGGYGYVNDYPVERYLRDAKITQIYEGTNEIQ